MHQPIGPWLIIGGVIAIVAAFAIISYLLAAKRRKELAAWAASKGLAFSSGKDHGIENQYPTFRCLREGENRYAYNIVVGEWAGRPIAAFDYHYETHSHDSKGRRQTQHHYFSAVVLRSDLPLKPLFIRHEGLFDKVKGFFGHEDINFESAEFSREFYVTAEDRRWAYDVLHARTIQFLLDSPVFTLQFDRNAVIAYHTATFRVPEFEAAAEVIRGILDRLPEYLVKQLKEG